MQNPSLSFSEGRTAHFIQPRASLQPQISRDKKVLYSRTSQKSTTTTHQKKKKKFSTVSWDCWWGQWSLRIARPSGLLTSMCKPKVRSSTRETFPKRHSRSTVHVRILFQAPQHSSPALFPYPPPCCLNHCLLLCLDFSKARIFSWIVNSSDAWFWSPWNY